MKSQSSLYNSLTSQLCRVILGIVFIYAGIQKLSDPAQFAVAVQNYRLLPEVTTNFIAVFLPWIEFYCGLFLLVGVLCRASAILLAVLNLLFIFAITSALLRGLDIACGCFGADDLLSWSRVLQNVLFLVVSLLLAVYPPRHFILEQYIRPEKGN